VRRASAQCLNANGTTPRAQVGKIRTNNSRLKYRKE
jgi:hypothetical protein